ncbi:MAG: DUF309 domain-containing protein [Anaerolineae bacterium]|nr:DUF309 domain-containing protein [Anaerolineae bacterium]
MKKPIILIIGQPEWSGAAAAQLSASYTIQHQPEASGYMNTLIESRVAMVLVDGDSPDWQRWTSTPKSSPATRRIAVIVVSRSPEIRTQAPLAGADATLAPDEIAAKLGKYAEELARVLSPEVREQLDCECAEALPPLAQEGVRKFNAGEYYKQHDLFEEQWVNTETPVRDLYRAILQVGVAYYQIERGNYRGALKMLQRSVQWLVVLPDVCQGVNIQKLREDSFRVRAELERLGEERFHEFNHALIRGVELVGAE